MTSELRWFAVHVRSNKERSTAEYLNYRQVENFLPVYNTASSRTDRKKILTLPLFTGYIFVKISLRSSKRVEVLKAPGVIRLIGFNNTPIPIPDETIQSLRILVGDGNSTAQPHPLIKEGRKVVVVAGPFAGALGMMILGDMRRKSKLVVEIEFLGRAVSVPILPDQVKPLFS